MPSFFYDLSTPALSKVIDDNLIAKSLSFARLLGGEVNEGNPYWFVTGAAMPDNNGIVRADFDPGAVNERIQEALAPFQSRSLPVTWWVGPTSAPSNLGRFLQPAGFSHNRDMIGMAMDLAALRERELPMPGLTFERVAHKEALLEWYGIILRCFPSSYSQVYINALAQASFRPDAEWRHYIGRVDGRAAAVSSVLVGAGVAGLYNLGTHPDLRGQGLGAWITARSFLVTAQEGFRVGTLQTTYPNALRMYHRMGFEVYCKIGIYNYLRRGC